MIVTPLLINREFLAAYTVSILGFISGTGISWPSPIIPKLHSNSTDENPLGRTTTANEDSWIASLMALGAILGPLICMLCLNRIGRKSTIIVVDTMFILAYGIVAFAQTIPMYYVARVLMGTGIGSIIMIAPLYISEIAQDANRGTLSSTVTFFIMGGLFASYVLGPYLTILALNCILFGIALVFVPLFWWICPETPYYYMLQGQEERARNTLIFLRHTSINDKVIAQELDAIRTSNTQIERKSVVQIIRQKNVVKAFIYSVILTTLQQLSGINVVTLYAQTIFQESGGDLRPEISSIILGALQFSTSVLTPVLIERTGRKNLLLVSSAGSALFDVILGAFFCSKTAGYNMSSWSWLPIVSMLGFIVCYNSGVGTVPWIYTVELLPMNVKMGGYALVTSVYWISGFLLTRFFGAFSQWIGMGASFIVFAGCCLFLDVFVYFFLFETKGKSFQEIQVILSGNKGSETSKKGEANA